LLLVVHYHTLVVELLLLGIILFRVGQYIYKDKFYDNLVRILCTDKAITKNDTSIENTNLNQDNCIPKCQPDIFTHNSPLTSSKTTPNNKKIPKYYERQSQNSKYMLLSELGINSDTLHEYEPIKTPSWVKIL
jgi:hypothetical protein